MSTPFPTFCQNVLKDESGFQQFLKDQFKTFFAQFNRYLTQFQKPNEQNGFRQRKALNSLKDLLSNVEKIISKTQYENYSREMDQNISSVMEALINPKTPDDIRQPSIKIFYALIDKLNDHAFDVLHAASEWIFDFNIIKNECQNSKSNYKKIYDDNKKIQFSDYKTTSRDQLMKNIDEFQKIMVDCSDQKYTHYFSFFTQMLLIPAYLRNIKQSETVGIIGPSPIEIHKAIVIILDNATKRSSAFSTVIRDNIEYFFEAASQSASVFNSKLKESQIYVFDFFNTLCTVQKNANFFKTPNLDLIIKGMQSIFAMIQSPELANEYRIRYIDICINYFQQCLDLFPATKERKTILSQFVTWSHEASMPQILMILLIGMVNKKIEDPELWDLIKTPGKSYRIFLTTLSYFASYFAFSISESLLCYKVGDLKMKIESMVPEKDWLGSQFVDIYSKLSGIEHSLKDVFERSKSTFAICHDSTVGSIILKPIEGNIWKPFVEATKNMNVDSISDPDISFKVFVVGISFVYPLLKLMSLFPPQFKYEVGFVIENYLDWLKGCCSPTATNPEIIIQAIMLLDLIFCNKQCQQIISKEAQIDWLLTIQTHMKSENKDIQTKAIQIAYNSLCHGIFGAYEILNQDLLTKLASTKKKLKSVHIALMSINIIDQIDPDYKANYLFRILLEAIYHKETDECLKILDAISNLLKQNRKLTDVYNLWPMVLCMKEMVALNSDAVDDLIIELINVIPQVEPTYGDALLQFVCDMIIYSSSEKGISRFKELPTELQKRHVLLYLSHNFNNLVCPLYQTNDEKNHYFSNRNQEILHLYDKNKLSSNLAIGHFAFQFEQKDNNEPISALNLNQADSNTQQHISSPLDYSVQTDLNQKLDGYFTEELYQPSDFKIDCQVNQNADINYPENYTPKLVPFPQNVGPVAAAFMSSSGFYEPLNSYRFVPCGFPEFEPKLDFTYKTKVEVDLRYEINTPSCQIFQEGLGIPDDQNGNSTIHYEDCRYSITFFKNSATKAERILVIWNDRKGQTFIPEIEARIQIEEVGERYFVRCLFKQGITIPPVLSDSIVTMESLPTFIIGRILTISRLLDEPKKAIDAYSKTAEKLRIIEEENFPQASRKYQNEKDLLLL